MLQHILDAIRQYRYDLLKEDKNIEESYHLDKALMDAERLIAVAIRLKGEGNGLEKDSSRTEI